MSELEKKITDLVGAVMGCGPVQLSDSFEDELEMDDLDVLEVLLEMEQQLGVEITEADEAGIKRVVDLVRLVEAKKANVKLKRG